jgi:hypothetical protein
MCTSNHILVRNSNFSGHGGLRRVVDEWFTTFRYTLEFEMCVCIYLYLYLYIREGKKRKTLNDIYEWHFNNLEKILTLILQLESSTSDVPHLDFPTMKFKIPKSMLVEEGKPTIASIDGLATQSQ